jgi:glucose-6-phosphate isomerase
MSVAHHLLSQWPSLDASAKRARLHNTLRISAGSLREAVATGGDTVESAAMGLWRREARVWSDDPAVQRTIANRLGWLDSPAAMAESVERLRRFAENAKRDGFTHVILLGMSGSSLAPEVLRSVIGVAPGWPEFQVLDSTDPAAVLAAATPLDRTMYLLASGTLELAQALGDFKSLDPAGRRAVHVHLPREPRLVRDVAEVFLATHEGGR